MKAYIESLESLSRSQLVLLLARRHRDDTEPLAIAGAACRLPGGLDDPAAFWSAVRAGHAVPTENAGVPHDSTGAPRWNVGAADIAPTAPWLGKGGYLKGIDLFDAGGHGVDNAEARYLDPQHRLLLTEAARALADARLPDLGASRVGVFVSATTSEYGVAGVRNAMPTDRLAGAMSSGAATSAAAGRIAAGLGLSGPALAVDTACSSTLTALHLASAALRGRECDVAVVGSAHLVVSPYTTEVSARAGMLSTAGRSRPFTARADGYARSEGCVVFVLVRERDAPGVPYALLRGSSVHQHGGRASMVGVSSVGQREAITACLRRAGVDPSDVDYVEAHGGADPIADATEIDAIAGAYGRDGAGRPPLFVGSGKANIGYLETAAGGTGVLRAALALCHGELPPQPGFDDPAPAIPWSRLSVRVPTAPLPWPGTGPRFAGVNAFGFTGTNAHVLLQAPAAERQDAGALPPRAIGERHWLDDYVWH